MIKEVQEDFGRLDILVNNAGIQHVAPVHEFPDDKWDALIAILLSSSFHTTKAALPFMLEQGWGRIINTGSMHALVASPYKSAYNAAKHGIAGDSRTHHYIKDMMPLRNVIWTPQLQSTEFDALHGLNREHRPLVPASAFDNLRVMSQIRARLHNSMALGNFCQIWLHARQEHAGSCWIQFPGVPRMDLLVHKVCMFACFNCCVLALPAVSEKLHSGKCSIGISISRLLQER